MGSFGPEGGPPCEMCHQLPSVYHSDAYGLMCYRCLQENDNMCWAVYLGRKYRTHPFLGNPIIMFNIAGFILGTGLDWYCRCGECDPNWFLRGWVCYDAVQQDWKGNLSHDHHSIISPSIPSYIQPFISSILLKDGWLLWKISLYDQEIVN